MTPSQLTTLHEVVVTDDGTGVASALVSLMQANGLQSSVVSEVPQSAEAVVFLGGLKEISSEEDAMAINRNAFLAAHQFAQNASNKKLFVTVQDTGGSFGLRPFSAERAFLGGLAGLAKTASQEWAGPIVKSVDLERGERTPEDLAFRLWQEILQGGPEVEVGLHVDGTRITLCSENEEIVDASIPFTSKDVFVVSGGARGVTAATVMALAKASKAKMVLLGRTALQEEPVCCRGVEGDANLKRVLLQQAKSEGVMLKPAELSKKVNRILSTREIRSTLQTLKAIGSEARYVSVDVTDEEGIKQALTSIRSQWGPISGVIHGAGVLADKAIAQKTVEQFDFVFHTKVNGLRALLSATKQDPLRLICFFSSVAGRTGNVGQSDYAMANEVLNKVAQLERRRRGSDVIVKSLGWGPWEGGMVTPALKKRFEQMGAALIPLEEGGNMLVREFAHPEQVELVLGGRPIRQPLLAKEGELERNFHVVVKRETDSYLLDHSIHGSPVVPVVLVTEWFTRAARALFPEYHLNQIKGLKVLRGIVLKKFEQEGDSLVVHCRQRLEKDGAIVDLTLLGPDGSRHYHATAELSVEQMTLPTNPPTLQLSNWGNEPIYDGHVLFHGNDFQVIRSMDGVSSDGISATLTGLVGKEWENQDWQTDIAAFDGGLQLAVLWAKRMLGGATLPTSIAQIQTHPEAVMQGDIRCFVKGRETSKHRTLSDVMFVDDAGSVFASFSGVETHIRPN